MNVEEAIKSRRSIHTFKPELVDRSTLMDIVETASWAPTHRMVVPWNVFMYQENGIAEIADATIESYRRMGYFETYTDAAKERQVIEGIKKYITSIPHHAVIHMKRNKENPHFYEEDYAAVCAFIQNVQLAAWEKGVGVLWTSPPLINDPEFLRTIGLDHNQDKVVAILQMGYPDKIPRAKARTPMHHKLSFID
ncbi:nitroreductase family protein [Thalassobacillus hwangdonensis]|uniref:Nitroreductase n=1 Tax=Thalassobacillus hwangdonensis TaxID=546108 RepID=A0ABW3L724_9BACI